jgi:hypothetical protein
VFENLKLHPDLQIALVSIRRCGLSRTSGEASEGTSASDDDCKQDKWWRSLDSRVTTKYFYDNCQADLPQEAGSMIQDVAPAAEGGDDAAADADAAAA